MVVFETLADSVSLLGRRPKLLAYLVVASVVANALNSGELLGLSEEVRLLLGFVSLVVGPAIAVGVDGLVNDAAGDDRVAVGAFFASVLQNYLPWVAAILVLAFASFVVALLLFVAVQIPLVNLLAGLGFLVLALAAGLSLQFVDLAIVVDDAGPVAGIQRSYEVALAHLGSVVGYTLLEIAVVLVVAAPLLAVVFGGGVADPPTSLEPTPGLLGAFGVAVVGSVVVQTWRVLFYRRLSDRTAT